MDSWSKTDKKDSRSLSLALWMQCVAHECTLPTIYKPTAEVRQLRKLFAQYDLLNKQIRQYKNAALATLYDAGIILTESENRHLFNPTKGLGWIYSKHSHSIRQAAFVF